MGEMSSCAASIFPAFFPETTLTARRIYSRPFRERTASKTREIDLANFVMDNSHGRLEAEGRIDFSHALNIRVRPSIFQAATSPASASPPSFLLTGTIEIPKLVLPSAISQASSAAQPSVKMMRRNGGPVSDKPICQDHSGSSMGRGPLPNPPLLERNSDYLR